MNKPYSSTDTTSIKNLIPVVIVGAGISGLAAAVKLYQHGFQNVTVLEARDRVGGRIHSISKDNVTFEEGAQWLQEGLEEMLEEFPVTEKIQLHSSPNQNFKCVFEDEANATEADAKTAAGAADILYEIFSAADLVDLSMPMQNVLSYMETGWKKYVEKKKVLQKPVFGSLFEILCRSFCTYDGCNSLDELGLASGYEKIGEETQTIHGSLSQLIRILFNVLPKRFFRFNHKVTKINWLKQDVVGSSIRIFCSTDENDKLQEFLADYVVVTLPLGVLKKQHSEMFYPPLNQEKSEAIDRLGFGITNKIILHYDKPILKSCSESLFIWKTISNDPPWWKFANNPRVLQDSSTGKVYICLFLAGNNALQVEKLDQQEVGKICSKILQKFLKLPELPIPKFTHVTKWGSDPYCYGSYSFMPVGCRNEHFEELAKPLYVEGCNSPPRVLFAGEATHSKHFSTIHGAYYSGIREAQRLIEKLQ